MRVIDANNMHYRKINDLIREAIHTDKEIYVKNVNGQRYIGDGLQGDITLTLEGTPGNDMAAFMDGPRIFVKGNGQDAIANTMNKGSIIIQGHTGDTLGYAMRGGTVFVKSDVGYRVGIHMKEYMNQKPAIVIGGCAGDFLGEYMAGGIIILLGLNKENDDDIVGSYCGTGMHGGVMYIRGGVKDHKLGKEVKSVELDGNDKIILKQYIKDFSRYFNYDYQRIMNKEFTKLIPVNKRPYGNLYAYI